MVQQLTVAAGIPVLSRGMASMGIRRARHAIACGLFADFVGITVAILASYWFFG